ncbi:prion-inhibition and propagation-domain-containing protein [Xylaria cf. heliscus]|nr:prion-inhibition and propagation-domain-containing protein [Xylaria cf. heliscus]
MEVAGLSIGIVGLVSLFSTCTEIAERWDSYKSSVVESASLRARLTADRVRFQQWGQSVGIGKDRLEDNHHKALDKPSIRSAIDLILQSIKNLDEGTNRLAPYLDHFSDPAVLLPDQRLQSPKSIESSTRLSRIGWALRGKRRAILLVESFNTLVQTLHDLIPPRGTTESFEGSGAESSSVNSSIKERNASLQIDIQNMLIDLEKHIHVEVLKDLIDWLDAPGTKGTYHDRINRRLKGTCDWILARAEFQQWQSLAPETPKVLWINGPPGYGKTILAARIVEHLLSANPETGLAYFFFSSETKYVDPITIMRAWVSQLVTQTEQGFDLAREKWEAANERTASQFEIRELFSTIVQNIPKCTLVVDGLDECDITPNGDRIPSSSVSEFLDSLVSITLESRAKVLIVSRNELAIREGLRVTSNGMKQFVELQINPNDVVADATVLSRSVVDRKLGNKSEAQRDLLANKLVDRCNSMFLGIKLLEDDLTGGENLKQLQTVIDKAPNKLDHIYDRNWERIQRLEESDRHRAFSILRWAAFGERPLTVLEITEALLLADGECENIDYEGLPDSIDSVYIKTEILDLCVSLVEIRPGLTSDLGNSIVHLTHFSVRQYIICHMLTYPMNLMANEQLRASNEDFQNNIIAKACLRYLNCEQIWRDPQPEDTSPAIQAFRDYAAGSWHKHFKVTVNNWGDVLQLINAFFRPTNPKWNVWRKYIDGMYRYTPIHDDGSIDTGNPLRYASLLGLWGTVYYLIDEVELDVNQVDSSNRTALLAASETGSLTGTTYLLQKGANLNTDPRHCTSPQQTIILKS